MISQQMYDRLISVFLPLQRAAPPLAIEIQRATYLASFSKGKLISFEGDCPTAMALVLSGTIRVFKMGKNGREITLYRFGSGESCILTANAILNQDSFPANAVVEQPVEAVMIPEEVFRGWVKRSDLWREFFFRLLSQRLVSVLALVDDVVFRRLDSRVAAYLQQQSQGGNPITVTHQEIAAELGSSREVISRILLSFSTSGLLRSSRGTIEILDPDSLNLLSTM